MHGRAVLTAPPGAGKTTVVPLALLDEPWLAGRRIALLEPRRLAARAAARRMSAMLGDTVGGRVGHRMRLDTRVSARTRIEVVTEGVLTRLIQDDRALDGYGLVIFDEFHERSLHADLGLALVLQSRELLRPDLRLLVMSATLDAAAIAAALDDAPVIASEGRPFPVEIRWHPPRAGQTAEGAAAGAVREALARDPGDVLVFMPGAAEIRRTAGLLHDLPRDTRVHTLFGALSQEAQDAALAPAPRGERKVVIASAIAETSLTIEGVRTVVDAGLARVSRFDPRSGMSRLTTTRVSQAGATQRAGRAGRVAPGVCYRLWHEYEHAGLPPRATPEILDTDLAPLALELAVAGVRDVAELRWIDPPPAAALGHARELLVALGAFDASGRVSAHGRAMAGLPMHPRLAHMVLRARASGSAALATACDLAALLEERDLVRGANGPPPADLRARLALLAGDDLREAVAGLPGATADRDGVRRVRQQAQAHRRRMGVPDRAPGDAERAGLLVAYAYPERVAVAREAGGRYLTRGGGGVLLVPDDPLRTSPWLAVAETDGRRPEARVALAAPVDEADILRHFADEITVEEEVGWDDAADSAVARRRERLGAIVLREAPLRNVDPARMAGAVLDWVRRAGIAQLPWPESARRLRARMAFAYHLDPARWPDVSDDALLATLDEWLLPFLDGAPGRAALGRVPYVEALLSRLTWADRAELDELAPAHLDVPSGSRIPVDYAMPDAPVLAVRLQELFGQTETPTVGRGRVPVVVHLLSPARRPVQVTRDLAGFWRAGYFDVRKDLRGRYPKHHWPDDPLAAAATSRAKRRGE